MITQEQFERSRAQAREDDENERLRYRLLRGSPTSTYDYHARLKGHLAAAAAELQRGMGMLHSDHRALPAFEEAHRCIRDAQQAHALLADQFVAAPPNTIGAPSL